MRDGESHIPSLPPLPDREYPPGLRPDIHAYPTSGAIARKRRQPRRHDVQLGLRNAGREPVPGRSVDAAPARRRTVPALAAGRSSRRAEATSQGSDRWSLQPPPLPRSMDGRRERHILQVSPSRTDRKNVVEGKIVLIRVNQG